nr:hypothetical protein [Tanacetum cinerariifolium]
MWRVAKGCSGVETTLFEGMIATREPEKQGNAEEQGDEEEQGTNNAAAEELVTAVDDGAHFPMSLLQEALDACVALTRHVEYLEHDKVAQDLEILKLKTRVKKLERANKVKTVKLRRLRKVGTSQRIESSDNTLMEDVSNQWMEFNRAKDAVKETEEEAVKVVTTAKLITEVVAAVSEIVSAVAVISSAVPETISVVAIPTVTALSIKVAAPVIAAVPSTRRKKEESSVKTPTETTSKDKGKGILVEEPKPMKKKQQVELDEAYARKLQEEFNQDIDWEAAIDHVKQRAKEEPFIPRYQVMKKRPQTEAQARRNRMMYLKNTAGFTLDYFKGISYDDIRPIFMAKFNANMEFLLKSKEQIEEEEESRAIVTINETLVQKAAKRKKLIEEAKEAETIKLHLQIVPDEDDDVFIEATPLAMKVLIVDYQVILVNNKPRYKIIKANDTHQLYVSFITMLKIDREDLETLWRIVKERFSTSKPKNFSYEYLLTALKTMFERPDGQDNIILLVERRYPLTKFTLAQMLNVVRLQVEEESEMSLELIRFTRQ